MTHVQEDRTLSFSERHASHQLRILSERRREAESDQGIWRSDALDQDASNSRVSHFGQQSPLQLDSGDSHLDRMAREVFGL